MSVAEKLYSRFHIERLEERIAPKRLRGGGSTVEPPPSDSGTGTTSLVSDSTSEPVIDDSWTQYDSGLTDGVLFDPNYYDFGWSTYGW